MLLSQTFEDSIVEFLDGVEDAESPEVYRIVHEVVDAALIKIVLSHTRNNRSKATRLLGISRGTLIKKIQQLGFKP